MIVKPDMALSLDDVILEPRYSKIKSRYDQTISLETKLGNLILSLPIISANMDTVTEYEMANTLREAGGLGIVHRFMTPEQQAEQLLKVALPRVICIGVGENEFNRFKKVLILLKHCASVVLIDIAHGHSKEMILQIQRVKKYDPHITIIAGNVATAKGVEDLCMAGADIVKCGVGNGSLCTTRLRTGNGIPQFTAIKECSEVKLVPIIADGGIKTSGDIVKALAAGASAVMIGSLLAGCDETPGELFRSDKGMLYKRYRGMASSEAQLSWKGMTHSIEGESQDIPYKGKASRILLELKEGLLSGMSYQGATNLKQLQDTATFRIQSHSGYIEGLPHGKL